MLAMQEHDRNDKSVMWVLIKRSDFSTTAQLLDHNAQSVYNFELKSKSNTTMVRKFGFLTSKVSELF